LYRLPQRQAVDSLQYQLAAGADQSTALDVVVAPAAGDDFPEVADDFGADVNSHQICSSRKVTV